MPLSRPAGLAGAGLHTLAADKLYFIPRLGKCLPCLLVQTHAIMGTNGSGKSTLSKCLVGHPDYTVTAGSGDHLLVLDSVVLRKVTPCLPLEFTCLSE